MLRAGTYVTGIPAEGSRGTAMVIEAQAGFLVTLAELALMDMAARATPRGSEGLGFALVMSVRNGALGRFERAFHPSHP